MHADMDDATVKAADFTRRTEKVFGRIVQQCRHRLSSPNRYGRSSDAGRRRTVRRRRQKKFQNWKEEVVVLDLDEEGRIIVSTSEEVRGGGSQRQRGLVTKKYNNWWQYDAPVWHCTATFQ